MKVNQLCAADVIHTAMLGTRSTKEHMLLLKRNLGPILKITEIIDHKNIHLLHTAAACECSAILNIWRDENLFRRCKKKVLVILKLVYR